MTRRGFMALAAYAGVEAGVGANEENAAPVFQTSFNHQYWEDYLSGFPFPWGYRLNRLRREFAIAGNSSLSDAMNVCRFFEINVRPLDGYTIPNFPLIMDGDCHDYNLTFYRVGLGLWYEFDIDGQNKGNGLVLSPFCSRRA